jgi:hypothetical protein
MRALLVLALLATPAVADVQALTRSAPACDAARTTCLGLALHVAVVDGKPIATAEWLADQLVAANHHFAKLGVGYRIASIDALPASEARVESRRQRTALGKHVSGTVIHVFVTGYLADVDQPGDYIRGVAWRRGDTKYVILSTVAPPHVLAHELGHVFGLPHSDHAISIMNKTPRDEPPLDQRTFAEPEYRAMKRRLDALLRSRALRALGT